MVSLHGFSILILLTQSNHKSALLFSCSAPFQVHTPIIYPREENVKRMFAYFRKKVRIFIEVIHSSRRKKRNGRKNAPKCCIESPPAARKRRSASGSARTPFRGGLCHSGVFFLFRPFGDGGFFRLCGCTSVCAVCLLFPRLRLGLWSCVFVNFRRELVCGGAKRRRTRL